MLEDDEAGEPAAVDQRNAGPGALHAGEPGGHRGCCASPLDQPAVADRLEIEDEAVLLDMAEQRLGALAGAGTSPRSSSSAPAGLSRSMLVGEQQQAAGRAADVGERLHHPLLERRAVLALRPTVSVKRSHSWR